MVKFWSNFFAQKMVKENYPFRFLGNPAKSKHQAIFSTKYLHNTLCKYK